MNPHIGKILNGYGLKTPRLSRPADAKLAQVYFVDDLYVLRSRPFETDTTARFEAERHLYGKVAELTGFKFPQYEPYKSGTFFVIEDDCFWTLHKLIPGHPLGSWFDLHRIEPAVNRRVLKALGRLHEVTKGFFDEKTIDRTRLLLLVAPALEKAPDYIGRSALVRLQSAFESVKKFCRSYPPQAGCFVHGDFHHGNILAQGDRISGFIDLDWCRVGSFYEDLAFTMMMLLRDYKNWSPAFRWPLYRGMLDDYGFKGDAALLNDHLILYALFDCAVFQSAHFDEAKAFFDYQKRFLESVCRTLPIES